MSDDKITEALLEVAESSHGRVKCACGVLHFGVDSTVGKSDYALLQRISAPGRSPQMYKDCGNAPIPFISIGEQKLVVGCRCKKAIHAIRDATALSTVVKRMAA